MSSTHREVEFVSQNLEQSRRPGERICRRRLLREGPVECPPTITWCRRGGSSVWGKFTLKAGPGGIHSVQVSSNVPGARESSCNLGPWLDWSRDFQRINRQGLSRLPE